MKTAQQLFEEAFGTDKAPAPRSPRSDAYKLGVRNQLRYRLLEIEEFPRPYDAGTAESDAYYSGVDEAWNLLRKRREREELRS